MGKDDKLNLIIMRDDSPVRRYRLRVAWFRVFLYAQVVMLLAAAGGGYGGFHYWVKNVQLLQANISMEETISEMQMQLERLQNIEEILKSNDPEEIHSLFSTVAREKRPIADEPVDLAEVFVARDMQLITVSNVQIQDSVEGLRLSFELNNLNENTISGATSINFIARDASVIQAQGDKEELSFAIQRFRRVNTLVELPPGLALEDLFALRLVINNAEGEVMFIQTYPLANIVTS